MRILVTGASGFVGQHLLEHLRANGHKAEGIGQQVRGKLLGCHQLDLLDEAAVRAFDFAPYDAIIHLAGLAAVGPSFEQPRRYIDANAGMEISLFEAVLAQKTRPRFLIISTGGVYAPVEPPLTEDSPLAPANPYAVSKITQELLATYYAKRDLEVIVARPFNHIGPGQNEGFLVADLAKQIAASEKDGSPIKVGNLESQRDYTDVRDIVRAYRLLIEKGQAGEIYNVCSGQPRSGQEMLKKLLGLAHCEVAVEPDSARLRPAEHQVIYGSHEKLTKDTGWEPEIRLEQTLKDVLADWRSR